MTSVATFSPESGLIDQITFLKKVTSVKLPIVVTNKKITYYDIPCAFDIEVSSFYKGDEKCGAMYIWQFGMLNWVTYGRTWEEFTSFMGLLSHVLGLS